MKDRFLSYLFHLSKYEWINRLYRLYYELALVVVKVGLYLLPNVKAVYQKGSYGKNYFAPVISDLDFFIITSNQKKSARRIDFFFTIVHIIFPIVDDYDLYNEEEAQFLATLGDFKFISMPTWKPLKGDWLERKYLYHPRKFYLDILNEIHFQLEWLSRNLKTRKQGDVYKSLCIQRQYDKINDILNYLHDHQSYSLLRRFYKPNLRWADYTNEDIVRKFMALLERSVKIKQLHKIILGEFSGRDIDNILNKKYYRENLSLVDENFVYSGRHHHFTKDLFELFYFSGCIDSYLLFDWSENTEDSLGALFVKAQYYSKLIEGRFNTRHGLKFYQSIHHSLTSLKTLLSSAFVAYEIPSPNLFDRDVVLSVFEDSRKPGFKISEKVKQLKGLKHSNLTYVFICLNKGDNQEPIYQEIEVEGVRITCATLHIYNQHTDENIFQDSALFKIGVSWSFGARNLLMADLAVNLTASLVEEMLYLQHARKFKIVPHQVGFWHPLIISATKVIFDHLALNYFCNWNILSTEYLKYMINGKSEILEKRKSFVPRGLKHKILNLDYDLIHVSVETSGYSPSGTAPTLYTRVRALVERDILGFWYPAEKSKELWYSIGYLMNSTNYYALADTISEQISDIKHLPETYNLEVGTAIVRGEGRGTAVITNATSSMFQVRTQVSDRFFISYNYEVTVDSGDFYLLQLAFESDGGKESSSVVLKAFSPGHESSGCDLAIPEFNSNSKAYMILFIPEGKSKIQLEVEIELEKGQTIGVSLGSMSSFSSYPYKESQVGNLEELYYALDLIKGFPFRVDFKLLRMNYDFKAVFRSNGNSFPFHKDILAGLISAYGYDDGDDLQNLFLEFNFSENYIQSIRLTQLEEFNAPSVLEMTDQKIVFKGSQTRTEVIKWTVNLQEKYPFGDYQIQLAAHQELNRPVKFSAVPDNYGDHKTYIVTENMNEIKIPIRLDEWTTRIEIEVKLTLYKGEQLGFDLLPISSLPVVELGDREFVSFQNSTLCNCSQGFYHAKIKVRDPSKELELFVSSDSYQGQKKYFKDSEYVDFDFRLPLSMDEVKIVSNQDIEILGVKTSSSQGYKWLNRENGKISFEVEKPKNVELTFTKVIEEKLDPFWYLVELISFTDVLSLQDLKFRFKADNLDVSPAMISGNFENGIKHFVQLDEWTRALEVSVCHKAYPDIVYGFEVLSITQASLHDLEIPFLEAEVEKQELEVLEAGIYRALFFLKEAYSGEFFLENETVRLPSLRAEESQVVDYRFQVLAPIKNLRTNIEDVQRIQLYSQIEKNTEIDQADKVDSVFEWKNTDDGKIVFKADQTSEIEETFQYKLKEKYEYGFFEVNLKSYSELSVFKNLKIIVKADNSDCYMSEVSVQSEQDLNILLRMDEWTEFLIITIHHEVESGKEYGFEVSGINPIKFPEENYDYMGDIDSSFKLTKTYPGFYKAVLFLEEEFSGSLKLENDMIKYPSQEIDSSKILVYFWKNQRDLENLIFVGPEKISKVDLLYHPNV